MTMLLIVIRVVNVGNQLCKSFNTCLSPFCDRSSTHFHTNGLYGFCGVRVVEEEEEEGPAESIISRPMKSH